MIRVKLSISTLTDAALSSSANASHTFDKPAAHIQAPQGRGAVDNVKRKMRTHMQQTFGRLSIAAIGFVIVGTAVPAHADTHDLRKEGGALIRQIEEVGREVQYRADRLQQAARSNAISVWSHFHHLEQIKELVNSGLRPAIVRLDELQARLPDWKQESIDRMIASAKALAGDASSALMTKASNRSLPPVLNEEYGTLVRDLVLHSESLVKTSTIAGDYAAARLKAEEAGLKKSTP